MIIDNPVENLPKYTVVFADHPANGTRIIATREEQDEQLPVRWLCEIANDPKTVDYSTRSAFVEVKREFNGTLTTSELIRWAQEEGYGEWYSQQEETKEP